MRPLSSLSCLNDNVAAEHVFSQAVIGRAGSRKLKRDNKVLVRARPAVCVLKYAQGYGSKLMLDDAQEALDIGMA